MLKNTSVPLTGNLADTAIKHSSSVHSSFNGCIITLVFQDIDGMEPIVEMGLKTSCYLRNSVLLEKKKKRIGGLRLICSAIMRLLNSL